MDRLYLFGTRACSQCYGELPRSQRWAPENNHNGVPMPVLNGHVLQPIDAMPAMLGNILGPGIKGIVVAGMLAATMSVNSFVFAGLELSHIAGYHHASAAGLALRFLSVRAARF